jgi:polysaccharide export outer membrane protein
MRRLFKNWLLLLCFFLSLPAHAGGDYALTTGDLVRVSVYDHPDLITETRVTERGAVLFPLIGEIQVSGLPASEAASRIAKALDTGGFVRNPQVNVVVLEFKGQEVSVLGQVNRPGKFPLQKASRVTDILAQAGGVTTVGADSALLITHRDGKIERHEIDLMSLFGDSDADADIEIVNGDILYIPREPHFYIYGEVQRPGSFRLEKNMTVVQALSVGGGLSPRGTQKGMKILRRNAQGQMEEIAAQLSDMLRPDDVVYVKESLF